MFRAHWEGDAEPAVETPVGDFFCSGWGEFAQVNSIPVAVNPNGSFNCYWEMPFRERATVTVENTHDEPVIVYFQVDYWLGAVPEGSAYLHTQWRRSNPLATKTVHTLLDDVAGPGHHVGTYLAWGVNSSGWWGEGEVKFYLDDDLAADEPFPTICGTGTEDYFGGAWNFDLGEDRGGYRRSDGRYLPLQDDIASTAFFYSTATSTNRPQPPTPDTMEIC